MKHNQWDFEREPLPVVFQDPASGEIFASDCHHRTEAAIKAGLDKIWVDLRPGTRVDAILHSCGTNTMHGLPLRPKDQRKRIELFLDTRDLLPEGDERKSWSNRKVARYLGLSEASHRTVCNIIKERREKAALISQFQNGDSETLPTNPSTSEEEVPEEAPRPVDDQATEDTCEKICTVLVKTQSQLENTHAHRVTEIKAAFAFFREQLVALEADLASGKVLDVSSIHWFLEPS